MHQNNNIVEEVDIQANLPHGLAANTLGDGEGILRHVDDLDPEPDFDMHDGTGQPHADPAPANEPPRRRPVDKAHPYLNGQSIVIGAEI